MGPDPGAPRRLASFPFPFPTPAFRYRTNVEAARQVVPTAAGEWGATLFDCDADYRGDLALRADILRSEPRRCVVLAHMRIAAWDALLTVLTELQLSCPDQLSLSHEGQTWRWRNEILGVEQTFVFGDEDSLPCPPLEYAGSQVQDDLVLLDQREDTLFADAGLVTFAADWSLPFVIGMTFLNLHGPVPAPVHRAGVITRAHDLLLHLQPGQEIRRTNWLMTVGRHLDLSTERYPDWGPERSRMGPADLGAQLQLRVELQHLIRLPISNAILFTIRTYHASMDELASVPEWRERFAAVVRELPADLVAAKHMGAYYADLLDWLEEIQLNAST